MYRYVVEWKLALPLHPEFRTLPMLFYVPPLLPVVATAQEGGAYRLADDLFSSLENARLPIRYMAGLLAAGNEEPVTAAYKKLIAVRLFKRAQAVGDVTDDQAAAALADAGMTAQEAEAIYRLTALATYEERFVIPPMAREVAIEAVTDPFEHKSRRASAFAGPPGAVRSAWPTTATAICTGSLPISWSTQPRPWPGRRRRPQQAAGIAQAAALLTEFCSFVEQASPARLEELYTGTFDLQAVCYPYVGYHLFGDSYKRGMFMAQLNAGYRERGFSAGNELPDHVAVILRFLASGPGGRVQPGAARRRADPGRWTRWLKAFGDQSDNPYAGVIRALLLVLRGPDDQARGKE